MYIATLHSGYVVEPPDGLTIGRSMSRAGITTRVAIRLPPVVGAVVGRGFAVGFAVGAVVVPGFADCGASVGTGVGATLASTPLGRITNEPDALGIGES